MFMVCMEMKSLNKLMGEEAQCNFANDIIEGPNERYQNEVQQHNGD